EERAADGMERIEFTEKDKIGAVFTGENFTDQFIPFNFVFEADSLPETKTANIGSKEVSNGILFGEKSARYTLEKGDSLKIKFIVEGTNDISPLIFILNGNEAGKYGIKEGPHEIEINEPFESGSVLEIKTASSNWKIWAPSLYKLSNISISVKAVKEDVDQYIFNVESEYNTLQGGRMDLYLKENIGVLKIDLNGKRIFNAIPRDFQPIRFSKDEIRKGQNIMTFTAMPNSKFKGEVTMVLFYKNVERKSVTAVINLTESERNNLKAGTIRFKIVDVKNPGGVAVRIMRNDEITFSAFDRAETGIYSFDFGKDNVMPGISNVVVDELDGASFLVKDLDIKIEKSGFSLL
ncbi:MAG: hypothetical protein QMD85_05025, partial [Candidatus Aenigmarchaeota archaeon]|nr:hypothetical protein [Candidatus Aenigmarchaeota archaeon]